MALPWLRAAAGWYHPRLAQSLNLKQRNKTRAPAAVPAQPVLTPAAPPPSRRCRFPASRRQDCLPSPITTTQTTPEQSPLQHEPASCELNCCTCSAGTALPRRSPRSAHTRQRHRIDTRTACTQPVPCHNTCTQHPTQVHPYRRCDRSTGGAPAIHDPPDQAGCCTGPESSRARTLRHPRALHTWQTHAVAHRALPRPPVEKPHSREHSEICSRALARWETLSKLCLTRIPEGRASLLHSGPLQGAPTAAFPPLAQQPPCEPPTHRARRYRGGC